MQCVELHNYCDKNRAFLQVRVKKKKKKFKPPSMTVVKADWVAAWARRGLQLNAVAGSVFLCVSVSFSKGDGQHACNVSVRVRICACFCCTHIRCMCAGAQCVFVIVPGSGEI